VKSHAATTVKSHATANVKTPTSTMTATLGKGVLWQRAEHGTGDDCGKYFQQNRFLHFSSLR
jgi:hypothetical protein